MKKIVLLLIMALPFFANAQVEKGNVFLGGNLSFSTQSQKSTGNASATSSSLTVSPRIGFLLSNKSAIGGGIDVTHQKYTDGSTFNSMGVAFFHRLYLPITESFFFVLHSEVGGSFGKQGGINGAPDQKENSFYIRTGPRFAYFASKHWQFEATVGTIGITASSTKDDVDNAPKFNTTNFALNAGYVGLGVFYYFRK